MNHEEDKPIAAHKEAYLLLFDKLANLLDEMRQTDCKVTTITYKLEAALRMAEDKFVNSEEYGTIPFEPNEEFEELKKLVEEAS